MGTHIAENPGFSVEFSLHFSIKTLLKKKKPCHQQTSITAPAPEASLLLVLLTLDLESSR